MTRAGAGTHNSTPWTNTGVRHGLVEHCRSTAWWAGWFAASFGAGESAYVLGLFHDAGKASCGWQQRLLWWRVRGSCGGAAQGVGYAVGVRLGRVGDVGASRGMKDPGALQGVLGEVDEAEWETVARRSPQRTAVITATDSTEHRTLPSAKREICCDYQLAGGGSSTCGCAGCGGGRIRPRWRCVESCHRRARTGSARRRRRGKLPSRRMSTVGFRLPALHCPIRVAPLDGRILEPCGDRGDGWPLTSSVATSTTNQPRKACARVNRSRHCRTAGRTRKPR